jgi:DNA-binding HxlR family transcriptional regulator
MTGYGQFCSVARAHEVLGGRWTLLVVRELLCGARRFNDIRRGIPRISRTMLSERLQELVDIGAIARGRGRYGPEYSLTDAGRELSDLVVTLGSWGQRWLPRRAEDEDLDLDPLLVDMQRRVRVAALPSHPIVVRFEVDRASPRFLLLKASEVSLCTQNPGFPEAVCVIPQPMAVGQPDRNRRAARTFEGPGWESAACGLAPRRQPDLQCHL